VIDWGSVPDWLAGAGAVAALFFAAITARTALAATHAQARQLEQLQRSEDQREREEIRHQASKVTAWIRLDRDGRGAIICLNGSGQPIYNLTFRCETPDVTVSTYYAVKGPDVAPKRLNYATDRLRVGIESIAEAPPAVGYWSNLYRDNQLSLSMTFLDVNGRWWLRDTRGYLREINEEQAF
jgi:hypothetical protein